MGRKSLSTTRWFPLPERLDLGDLLQVHNVGAMDAQKSRRVQRCYEAGNRLLLEMLLPFTAETRRNRPAPAKSSLTVGMMYTRVPSLRRQCVPKTGQARALFDSSASAGSFEPMRWVTRSSAVRKRSAPNGFKR